MLSLPTQGFATDRTCTLLCDASVDCNTITLNWAEQSDLIEVDDALMSRQFVTQGTRLDTMRIDGRDIDMRSGGPMVLLRSERQFGTVVSSDDGTVILSLLTMPRRYVDYEDAMQNRIVAHGPCEGLF
ncbi:MAG: hypothetical protein ACU0GG_14620 [Paracoccaceae bacterium]